MSAVPAAATTGTRPAAPALGELLPRMPGPSWEGWFFIAVGRAGSAIRFAKWHLFRAASGRRHPIAAVEGLRGPGELCSFVGTTDHVLHLSTPIDPDAIITDRHVLSLTVPGRLRYAADGSAVRLRVQDAAAGLSAEVGCRPRDRLAWARWPGVLSYVGFAGELDGRINVAGGDHRLAGAAIVEHAWGASLPFDPLRARVPWQWDVLAFDGDDAPLLAALSIAVPRVGRAVRVRGRLPDGSAARFVHHRVDYLETDGTSPRRWRGRMTGPAGELDYEALAATPAAPAFPGGAFLGFDFTARWRGGGGDRRLQGTGFAEHRLPSG